MEKKKARWEIVVEALPGTLEQLAERTGMSKMAVEAHISTLKKIGIVKPAYRIFCPKCGRRAIVMYGHINAMPKDPEQGKATKPPKPRKVHAINSPYRTIWVGRNPHEVSHASN